MKTVSAVTLMIPGTPVYCIGTPKEVLYKYLGFFEEMSRTKYYLCTGHRLRECAMLDLGYQLSLSLS